MEVMRPPLEEGSVALASSKREYVGVSKGEFLCPAIIPSKSTVFGKT